MSRLKMTILPILMLALGACSLLNPFVDRRREAGAPSADKLYVGRSKPEAPAICYNGLWTSFDEVKKMADEECVKQKKGSHAEEVSKSTFTCRVLLPNHYYFKCVK